MPLWIFAIQLPGCLRITAELPQLFRWYNEAPSESYIHIAIIADYPLDPSTMLGTAQLVSIRPRSPKEPILSRFLNIQMS